MGHLIVMATVEYLGLLGPSTYTIEGRGTTGRGKVECAPQATSETKLEDREEQCLLGTGQGCGGGTGFRLWTTNTGKLKKGLKMLHILRNQQHRKPQWRRDLARGKK